VYAGWNGSQSDKGIAIDPVFAHSIELIEKTQVDIKIDLDIPIVSTVEVEPVTASDWEIIELHAGVVENSILFQTRTVQLSKPFVVYASDTVSATLRVIKMDPEPSNTGKVAMLANDTELHVAPKTRRSRRTKSLSTRSVSQGRPASVFAPSILIRGLALPHKLFSHLDDIRYEVYVNFDEIMPLFHDAEYVNVSIVPGPDTPKEQKVDEKAQFITRKVTARLIHDPTAHGLVGLSRVLAIALGVQDGIGFMAQLEKLSKPTITKNPILTFHPLTSESKGENQDQLNLSSAQAQKEREVKRLKQQKLKEDLIREFYDLGFNKTCLTKGMKLPALEGLREGGVLLFSDDKLPYILPIDEGKVAFSIGEEILIPRSQVPPQLQTSKLEYVDKPIGSTEILKDIHRALKKGKVGALIYGPPGCGKSLIVKELASTIEGRGIYKLEVNCNDFSRESLLNIKEKIDLWLKTCSWYSPSLLVLEGLEFLFPAEAENSDSSQTRQLSEYFIQAVNNVMKSRNISLIATAKSKEAVNSILFTSHCFDENFSIKAPTKETRKLIIEHYLQKYNLTLSKEFDGSLLSQETEGYLPSDLKVLVDRINHEAIYQGVENKTEASQSPITNGLFTKAIKGYVPSSLRGVKLQKSTTIWADIGGLTEAKSILLESLEWPTKYAPIFKAATLRLRSGILLYGYPGCGKTLLASAVAGQCGLNFISVKGPEILNKYIGASEQSVRELFERAQAAKPCILFFDEFDSIAPKRGHDSTGVTDRVVNQMLTQMDGAEGLDGVYVLAATSRPDLIDSALLRPGRLDKSVICDMPNYEDRLDILKATTRNMLLGDEVSLEEIAERSDGFSGADIQALGYNAYLQAVHEKLEMDEAASEGAVENNKQEFHEFFQVSMNQLKKTSLRPHERTKLLRQIEPLLKNLGPSLGEEKATKKSAAKSGVLIKHKDFITALKDTKPSISVSEKMKLSVIYHKFVAARDGNMQDGTPSNEVGARTTLA
jgi:peroxin-1